MLLKLAGTLPGPRARAGSSLSLIPKEGRPVSFLLFEFERHTDTLDEVLGDNVGIPVSEFEHSTVVGLQGAITRGQVQVSEAMAVLLLAQFLGMQTLIHAIMTAWKAAGWPMHNLDSLSPRTVEELRGELLCHTARVLIADTSEACLVQSQICLVTSLLVSEETLKVATSPTWSLVLCCSWQWQSRGPATSSVECM